jgi:hypothetical protein
VDIRAEVNAGVCGLASLVEAGSPDGQRVVVRIESDCPRVQALAGELADLDAFEELLRLPLAQTTPARLADKHGLHPTCPVPVAVLKAAEAAAGLALPCDCSVKLTRVE